VLAAGKDVSDADVEKILNRIEKEKNQREKLEKKIVRMKDKAKQNESLI